MEVKVFGLGIKVKSFERSIFDKAIVELICNFLSFLFFSIFLHMCVNYNEYFISLLLFFMALLTYFILLCSFLKLFFINSFHVIYKRPFMLVLLTFIIFLAAFMILELFRVIFPFFIIKCQLLM